MRPPAAPAVRAVRGGGRRAAAAQSRRCAGGRRDGGRVTVDRSDKGVAVVSLSRGAKYNALDMPMFREIAATATALRRDPQLRAVIIRGEGKAFCAGLDVRSVGHPLKGGRANLEELLRRPAGQVSNLAQDVGYLWRLIPCPVIAATHGVCFGGGFQIALGADLRVSHPDCRFSVMEAKWGLIPDMSGTVTLRDLVPKDVAMELTMTARIFKADEALRLGLVTRLSDDPVKEAHRIADEISTRSPDAAAGAKRLMHSTWCTSEQRALELETLLQRRLLGTWNMAASAAKGLGLPRVVQPAFRDRSPVWEDDTALEEDVEKALRGEYDAPPDPGAGGGAAAA